MRRALCVWFPHYSIANRLSLENVACWLGRFSPIVGLEQSERPESVLLDITGCGAVFGGEQALAEQLASGLNERGLSAKVAIADSVGAAWAMSRYVSKKISITPVGKTLHALRPLPLEALRLSPETCQKLDELGVTSVGLLERLPRGSLPSRFGSEILLRFDQAIGQRPEPIMPCPSAPDLRAAWPLEAAIDDGNVIRQITLALVERLIKRIEQASPGQGVERLECRFFHEPSEARPTSNLHISLFEASVSAPRLRALLGLRLESLRLPAPVMGAELRAASLGPLPTNQTYLFTHDASANQRDVGKLVERLQSRLGRQSALRAELVADHQPERSCTQRPFDRCRQQSLRLSRSLFSFRDLDNKLPRLPGALPLRMFARPEPISVREIAPGASPGFFWWRGRRRLVARVWRPERIETGWWRGDPVHRDYFCVETVTGNRCWLFRDLRLGRWFLHGWFE